MKLISFAFNPAEGEFMAVCERVLAEGYMKYANENGNEVYVLLLGIVRNKLECTFSV